MTTRNKRTGFTLIELLTVMAIITLLIGILTPAVGAARDRARATAVRAQLNAMEVGLVQFNADEGHYPFSDALMYAKDPANPGAELTNDWEVAAGSGILQGANLLVDALVGRDFLGYDPNKGTGPAQTVDSRWFAQRDRRKPYIPVDGVDTTSLDKPPEDAFGKVPSTAFGDPQPQIDTLLCRVFRDKFGWPILYYRANPAANQNTPIISMTGTPAGVPVYSATAPGNGVYDGKDNEIFTSYACGGGGTSNTEHRICQANVAMAFSDSTTGYGAALTNRFGEFIRSLRASTYLPPPSTDISIPRPVKSDQCILLSAGKDGIFGNLDDVANFQVLSAER